MRHLMSKVTVLSVVIMHYLLRVAEALVRINLREVALRSQNSADF